MYSHCAQNCSVWELMHCLLNPKSCLAYVKIDTSPLIVVLDHVTMGIYSRERKCGHEADFLCPLRLVCVQHMVIIFLNYIWLLERSVSFWTSVFISNIENCYSMILNKVLFPRQLFITEEINFDRLQSTFPIAGCPKT